jgi:hypothetical protein
MKGVKCDFHDGGLFNISRLLIDGQQRMCSAFPRLPNPAEYGSRLCARQNKPSLDKLMRSHLPT